MAISAIFFGSVCQLPTWTCNDDALSRISAGPWR
jgi:hypothetical protein